MLTIENLVNYAVAYAKAGMSVLPMNRKTPMVKFADQPPLTETELRKLWKSYPFANVALRTDKFLVVDIDKHDGGANGFDSIEEFNQQHPDLLIPTLKQKTAGGGEQLFYLKRDDIQCHQNIGWLPGVDIKAHKNNYVVVAPSHNNGRKYEWINKLPIATAPKELIRLINKNKPASSEDVDFSHYETMKTKTTLLFETIARGLGDHGGRNDNLTTFIGRLFFRGVEPEDAYTLACMANENTAEPLPMQELNKTFASVQKKELKRRGT